ncbi:DUF2400 family protein [Deinococcus yavapaiensis]|uniref:Uncharacterized protein DUF2400 n=1 Tax=Deinococcus yavapaiensis KR-236 TaxID=694435 RepID=A0A318S4P1_9DEIO|nr:DUF2400 family protein [Deinococcus yavapaiensis]PYE52038.1 uncharacterized protein DUF2400 [Deinococcus yavapaiensis KR-236]
MTIAEEGRASFEDVARRVHTWVERHRNTVDLQFADRLPLPPETHEGAGYLLMVAAINQQVRAEVVRDVMRDVHATLGEDVFNLHALPADALTLVWQWWQADAQARRWPLLEGNRADRVLRDVARFLEVTRRQGGLNAWAARHGHVQSCANDIARHVPAFGGAASARKKLWMYLRWMVRPTPDLGVWRHVHPRDLRIPLDVNTMVVFRRLATAHCVRERLRAEGLRFSGQERPNAQDVETATAMARWWYPDDPACVDYPFFLRGRELFAAERAVQEPRHPARRRTEG